MLLLVKAARACPHTEMEMRMKRVLVIVPFPMSEENRNQRRLQLEAVELGPEGIRVNTVVAGYIHSDRWDALSTADTERTTGKNGVMLKLPVIG